MEPIPESITAAGELDPVWDDDIPLMDQLVVLSDRVRQVAPSCVGMSLAYLQAGVSFTLVATDAEIATLDGVQYLRDGPCLAAVREEHVLSAHEADLLDEDQWRLFAAATAAEGLSSTLTLPVRSPSTEVVGSVNLYGATADTFAGHEEELADLLGAWAPGAVANADLAFETRRRSEQMPQVIQAQARIEAAVGFISSAAEVDPRTARTRLEEAAARAGVSTERLAEVVLRLGWDPEPG